MADERRDFELVTRCLAGEPAAWEEFVRRYRPLIEYVVDKALDRAGQTGRHACKEDLVQEILAALSHPQDSPLVRFRWESTLASYLVAVAYRQCFFARGRPKDAAEEYRLLPLARELVRRKEFPFDPLDQAEVREKVRSAVRQLSERERLVVQFYYWDGIPADRIGSVLKVSRPVVWKLLSDARRKLRALLTSLACILI